MPHEAGPRRNVVTPDRLLFTVVLLAVLSIWVFPMGLMLMSSLKTDAEVLQGPLALPRWPTLDAFAQAWKVLSFGKLLKNSFILASGGSALAVILASFPAFALSRFRIPGGEIIFVLLLTGMMLPQQTVVIPLYEVLSRLGLIDSQWGLILVHGIYGLPFVMLILRGFMVGIPEEVVSASRVDGCTDIGVFRYIVLPLIVPAMAVAFTLNFINIWKEFFFALIFLNSVDKFPITVGLLQVMQAQYFSSWNLPAAALLIAQLPIVVLYILAYRWVTQGIYAGAVKG